MSTLRIPDELHPLTLGALAYTAYGRETDFKNFKGEPMPRWEELPPRIRSAWVAAATAVYVRVSSVKDDA